VSASPQWHVHRRLLPVHCQLSLQWQHTDVARLNACEPGHVAVATVRRCASARNAARGDVPESGSKCQWHVDAFTLPSGLLRPCQRLGAQATCRLAMSTRPRQLPRQVRRVLKDASHVHPSAFSTFQRPPRTSSYAVLLECIQFRFHLCSRRAVVCPLSAALCERHAQASRASIHVCAR
jgi:hypothetical protein